MREVLRKFTTVPSIKIIDALQLIDANQKGFLIVVTEDDIVLGTLTDGDIRRAFLKGATINDCIERIYRSSYRSLRITNDISDSIELFKSAAIKFIPILDDSNRLCNLITKQQLHALLLMDVRADLNYDFMNLDENCVDYEIFQRPWGIYKTTVMNEYFQSKVIIVNPDSQLSLQSHNHREEYWIVAHGVGKVQIGESIIDVKCGSSLFIPKGCKHRLVNTSLEESLIITEVQIGDYFGEDDIIRYEDVYGRV